MCSQTLRSRLHIPFCVRFRVRFCVRSFERFLVQLAAKGASQFNLGLIFPVICELIIHEIVRGIVHGIGHMTLKSPS
jgi:hypothetical protein